MGGRGQPAIVRGTHQLVIERVLFDHDSVDSLGVAEGKEAETTRAASGAIAHNGAFDHLAELREVRLERFYSRETNNQLEGEGFGR